MEEPVVIPVLCDRCRTEGEAGEPPFESLGDLLDFEPVPRRPRVGGWSAEVQRAFIAALAVTGSRRRAAIAVDRAQFGVDQLLKAPGSEGFAAACARAEAMAAEKGAQRLAQGVRTVAAEDKAWKLPSAPWSGAAARAARSPRAGGRNAPAEPEPLGDDAKFQMLATIVRRYCLKLGQEREARLSGRIAEADFIVRQITFLEVSFDLMSGDGFALLADFRHHGHNLIDIAATPFSEAMDEARRRHFEEAGEPGGPHHPLRALLDRRDGYALEPLPSETGADPTPASEKLRAREAAFAEAAAEQVRWEAEARQGYERWRDGGAAS